MKVVYPNSRIIAIDEKHVAIAIIDPDTLKPDLIDLIADCSWFDPAVKLKDGMEVDIIIDHDNWHGYKVIPSVSSQTEFGISDTTF